MTEIAEMVNVAIAAPHTDDDCPFCKTKEEIYEKNFLTADYDEDSASDTKADNSTENHSGTLGKSLVKFKSCPKPIPPSGKTKTTPDRASELDVNKSAEKGEKSPYDTMDLARAKKRTWHKKVFEAGQIPVLYGAHHLIPGNDSLGSSDLFEKKKLGPVADGEDKDNIGYNVNSANNGVWLTSNYAVKGWKADHDDSFKKAYAFLAMLDSGRQFHDAHRSPYAETVRGALNELNKLLESMEDDGCPFCGEGKDKGSPSYHLNARLNAISRWLMTHLTSDAEDWKNNIVTSNWCKEYKNFVKTSADPLRELEEMRNKLSE